MTEEIIRHTINTNENPSASNLSNRLTRTMIREANNHLQMLYSRNQELERIMHEQKEELNQRDIQYAKLFKSNQLLEQHCQQLQALLDDRAQRLYTYERKEILFRETLQLKPALESLISVLTAFEQSDDAVQTCNTKPLQFISSQK